MKIGIPKEIHDGERRVATTPDVVVQLRKLGFDVAVESGAGAPANFADSAYADAGAEIVGDPRALLRPHDEEPVSRRRSRARDRLCSARARRG